MEQVDKSGVATWHTTFLDQDSGKLLDYDIVVYKNNKDVYNFDNKFISKREQT